MTRPKPANLLPAAVDTLPINCAILDEEGTILYTNQAWREFGRANDIDGRPDTVGTNYIEITAQAETDTAQAAATGLSEILAGDRERFEFEYPCHSPDEQRWFLMRASSFTDDSRRYVAVAHFDITERYQYRRRLEESNERLEQFAYAASHDLREPLRMVSNYLELIEERYGDELDADADEFIGFAVDGVERMRAMIDGLLTYSRVETQSDPLVPVDLEAVVDDVVRDLDMRIEETDANIRRDPLPTVRGDSAQLRQVFQNLLDNAIEYSGEQAPRVTVSATRDGDEWTVSVSDEGIGIDHDETERVFEMFERLHSPDEYAGTGIGLTLCQRIVERHGGDIWVEPDPDDGTTLSFTLPTVDETPE